MEAEGRMGTGLQALRKLRGQGHGEQMAGTELWAARSCEGLRLAAFRGKQSLCLGGGPGKHR